MKRNGTRVWLAVLGLAVVFGCGMQARQSTARAQESLVASGQSQEPVVNKQDANEEDAYRKSSSVVMIGRKLGLNPEQSATVFEMANFLMLAAAFGWVAAKTVPKMLRDRNLSIQKHLVDARTATEEARTRLSGVEDRLAKLDGEIAAMRAHAEQDLAKEEQRLKAAVEEERTKILASAEQEIAAATLHAQKQLQQHAAELAIEQAARKLVVSAETDRLLVQGFAQRLAGDESKKGQN